MTGRTAALRLVGAAILLASCRPGLDPEPVLGALGEVETAPVRLGTETRPTLAGADHGRGRVDLRLPEGSLVLAFGWRTQGTERRGEEATIRARFEARDGSSHPLAEERLAPRAAGEGWREIVVPVPPELAGRAGSIVFESRGAGRGMGIFIAAPKPVPRRGERPNLILISIDTLRSDRLGCYGHRRPTSPAIDAMAREGTRFRNAFAPSSWTLPSHYSMMTSLYPSAHGVNPDRWLFAGIRGSSKTFQIRGSGREETLAERLDALGYFTAAITEGGWVDARFGFDQGFSSYLGHDDDRLLEGTQRLTLDWVSKHRDLPFFVFVHTYQTHQPYHQPPPYDTLFVDPDHIGYALPGVPLPIEALDRFKDGSFPPMPGDVEAFGGQYDGEVRYVDAFLEALLSALRREGLEQSTIVLLTSDHGEEIFEHGNFDHGGTLYDEVLRVPFILWGPGRVPAGETHDDPVALLDILPTLVELAGGEPGGNLQGRSLVPLLRGETDRLPDRILFAEGFADESVPLASARAGSEKLILHRSSPERAELFDLARDSAETTNLAEVDPARVAQLRQAILRWQEESSRIREWIGEARGSVDAETARRLRALGYL